MIAGVNRPVKLLFQPTALEVKFQKSLKFQIAIFRASTDEKGKRAVKMDKTDPMKFTAPQSQIPLSNTLSLLTTIRYDPQTRQYQNKEVEFQMALDIDGTKIRMSKKINLREGVGSKGITGKFTMENPEITLLYRMEINVQGTEEEPKQRIKTSPNQKKIKFEDDYLSAECREDVKQNCKVESPPVRSDRGRHKTLAPGYPPDDTKKEEQQQHRSQTDFRTKVKKCKSFNQQKSPFSGVNSPQSTEHQESTTSNPVNNSFQLKYNQLFGSYRQLQSKLKDKDQRIVELSIKIEELELKIQMQSKSQRSAKELAKKEQASRANYQIQLTSLKDEIKIYKSQIQKLTKTALTYQQSSKNIAVGSEQEVKNLRDRIRQLQRANMQTVQEGEYYETNMKDKEQIIADLKNRIYMIDKENLQLQCKNKNLESMVQKLKEEYEGEVADLNQRVQTMKVDHKNIRLNSVKELGKEDVGELKKKVDSLEKQLERKEEILRKMTDLKKEAENEKNQENANLRKEVAELKQSIDKLESQNHPDEITSTTSIEYRLQMERMKKELEQFRKSQKTLLIEKNRLESSNHTLQDEVVKGKMAIANILNIVQQTGDQKLISEAYGFTE